MHKYSEKMNRVVKQKNEDDQPEIANVSVLITHRTSSNLYLELFVVGYSVQLFCKNDNRHYTEK